MNKHLIQVAFEQQWFSALNDRSLKDQHGTYIHNHIIEHAYVSEKDTLNLDDVELSFEYSLKDFPKSIRQMNDDILDHPGYLKSYQIDEVKSYESRCLDDDDFVNYSIDELVFEYIISHYPAEFDEYFQDEVDKCWMDFEANIDLTGSFDDIVRIEMSGKTVKTTYANGHVRFNYMR